MKTDGGKAGLQLTGKKEHIWLFEGPYVKAEIFSGYPQIMRGIIYLRKQPFS